MRTHPQPPLAACAGRGLIRSIAWLAALAGLAFLAFAAWDFIQPRPTAPHRWRRGPAARPAGAKVLGYDANAADGLPRGRLWLTVADGSNLSPGGTGAGAASGGTQSPAPASFLFNLEEDVVEGSGDAPLATNDDARLRLYVERTARSAAPKPNRVLQWLYDRHVLHAPSNNDHQTFWLYRGDDGRGRLVADADELPGQEGMFQASPHGDFCRIWTTTQQHFVIDMKRGSATPLPASRDKNGGWCSDHEIMFQDEDYNIQIADARSGKTRLALSGDALYKLQSDHPLLSDQLDDHLIEPVWNGDRFDPYIEFFYPVAPPTPIPGIVTSVTYSSGIAAGGGSTVQIQPMPAGGGGFGGPGFGGTSIAMQGTGASAAITIPPGALGGLSRSSITQIQSMPGPQIFATTSAAGPAFPGLSAQATTVTGPSGAILIQSPGGSAPIFIDLRGSVPLPASAAGALPPGIILGSAAPPVPGPQRIWRARIDLAAPKLQLVTSTRPLEPGVMDGSGTRYLHSDARQGGGGGVYEYRFADSMPTVLVPDDRMVAGSNPGIYRDRIVYLHDCALWMMNGDGSGQHEIFPAAPAAQR